MFGVFNEKGKCSDEKWKTLRILFCPYSGKKISLNTVVKKGCKAGVDRVAAEVPLQVKSFLHLWNQVGQWFVLSLHSKEVCPLA